MWEWEFACYGGSKTETEYCGGNDEDAVAWDSFKSGGKQTHPVGQKQANGYGLYDMSGNVQQMTGTLKSELFDGVEYGGYLVVGGISI